jgi:hypothetical protein
MAEQPAQLGGRIPARTAANWTSLEQLNVTIKSDNLKTDAILVMDQPFT